MNEPEGLLSPETARLEIARTCDLVAQRLLEREEGRTESPFDFDPMFAPMVLSETARIGLWLDLVLAPRKGVCGPVGWNTTLDIVDALMVRRARNSHGLSADASDADDIARTCRDFAKFLCEKNTAYGNSIFDPVRVFAGSHIKVDDLIAVRLDDKLSRLSRGAREHDTEDAEADLLGYLILLETWRRYSHSTPSRTPPPLVNLKRSPLDVLDLRQGGGVRLGPMATSGGVNLMPPETTFGEAPAGGREKTNPRDGTPL